MKKVIRISTYVIFSLGFGIFGYISFNNGDVESNKTKPEDVNKVSLHASWGEEEGSVEELVSETDLIVMGTLGEELETIEPRENIVYTKYDFIINETIKGETSKETIPLIVHGGVNKEGKTVDWELLDLDQSGTYLLFLRKLTDSSVPDSMKNTYISVNGPSGLYEANLNLAKTSKNTISVQSVASKQQSGNVTFSTEGESDITNKVSSLNLKELKNIVDNVSE